jgi:C-terminal processing protease CtpA/Prc
VIVARAFQVRTILLVATSVTTLASCRDALTDPVDARLARDHVNRILLLMELNSVKRNEIDWPTFKAAVQAEAADASHIGDTFGAIHTALALLEDNQAVYTAPREFGTSIRGSQVECTAPSFQQVTVPSDIGYARVSSFSGLAGAASGNAYATSLQNAIRGLDVPGLAGWIVDLRGSGGTSMWPMIAGLGPILGENVIGYDVDASGAERTWAYAGGVASLGSQGMQSVPAPYTLRSPDPRVAVLIDGLTSSAAEAAAIALKGRSTSRFFGTSTCGLSTFTATYTVDRGSLTLAVTTMADRNHQLYGGPVTPDETISEAQALIDRAIAWLREP